MKKKRGRPPKQTRLKNGSVKLTPTQSRIMDRLVAMHERGALPYGRHWNKNLASTVARALGLARPAVWRHMHQRLFREEFYRRTWDSRKTPGDPAAQLLERLESVDAHRAEVRSDELTLIRRELERDGDWERAIRRLVSL